MAALVEHPMTLWRALLLLWIIASFVWVGFVAQHTVGQCSYSGVDDLCELTPGGDFLESKNELVIEFVIGSLAPIFGIPLFVLGTRRLWTRMSRPRIQTETNRDNR